MKESSRTTRRLFSIAASAIAALCLSMTAAHAQDLGQLEAQMRKVTADANAKVRAGQKSYSIQNASTLDNDLNALAGSINSAVSCAGGKSGFGQQYGTQIGQLKQMQGYLQQIQSNPMVKAFASGPLASILQAAVPLARTLASSCQNFSGGTTVAAAAKYEKVSQVMKQVFTGGDLGPSSRAVRHAADVDMPARGGTPEALRAYLNSQNGTVKNWYKTNFGLR